MADVILKSKHYLLSNTNFSSLKLKSWGRGPSFWKIYTPNTELMYLDQDLPRSWVRMLVNVVL